MIKTNCRRCGTVLHAPEGFEIVGAMYPRYAGNPSIRCPKIGCTGEYEIRKLDPSAMGDSVERCEERVMAVQQDARDLIEIPLPEPPSLNQMIELAKKRTRRTRTGGWMKRSLPIVYDQQLERYETQCLSAVRAAGIRPPAAAWARWRIVSIHFRLHSLRDWLELAAGAKWCVDFLVRQGYVAGDSPREMEQPTSWPTQEVARSARGVVLTIEAVPD